MRKLLKLLVGLLLSWLSVGLAVSYTVQVVAVSSENSAADFQAYLVEQGFPAYLVTVPSAESYIFRLRVGSFANRTAAAAFAEALERSLEDSPLNSSPSPALAEGIPQDLIPFEAALLGRYSAETYQVEVRPWGDSVAVRTQLRDASQPATYFLDAQTSFRAWQAEPQADGSVVQIVNEALWPEAWPIETSEDLEAYRQDQLGRIAEALALDVRALSAFEDTDTEGVPYLVLARSYDPETQEASHLPAVGRVLEGGELELEWLSEELELPNWLPLFEAGISDPQTDASIGDWQVVADESYTRLQIGNRGWRAAVGTPLWTGANLLLSEVDGEWQLYRFSER